ncbi:MAG: U32 family peptidase [Lachnospiraceae bacterium]|nr:U32 family peptidase [Lachnospiraceae bacterium]
MRKVELLAPAGNFLALQGVIRAGADAIYLGGREYSARAYAENFSNDEIYQAIRLAHLYGRKIYLTVNTLTKEKELDKLYAYIRNFYVFGLDGVIVQDLGVLNMIHRCFPGLKIHASTQMSLTGSWGTKMLQKEGVTRIVPARELSLEEIRKIKARTKVEVETFVHGAMCYCYSGQCLFSSILGERSGNRGRCAQPCRLPFRIGGSESQFYLSMKDMCTLDILPELIDAGIDSFKIEGRMKRPEYAVGVTAIYRKYIDIYYHDPDSYWIHPHDRKKIHSLYIRSSVGEGYYHKRNGKELLTIDSPAYSETNPRLLSAIEREFLSSKLTLPTRAIVDLKVGHNAKLTLMSGPIAVTVEGDVVQKAEKRPLSIDQIMDQMRKKGNYFFETSRVEVLCSDEVFMPVSSLNELRRQAAAKLEDELIRNRGFRIRKRKAKPLYEEEPEETEVSGAEAEIENAAETEAEAKLEIMAGAEAKAEIETSAETEMKVESENEAGAETDTEIEIAAEPEPEAETAEEIETPPEWKFHAAVLTEEQLMGVLQMQIERIYVDYHLLLSAGYAEFEERLQRENKDGLELYIAGPYVSREDSEKCLLRIRQLIECGMFQGVLIRNLESLGYFTNCLSPEQIVLDTGIYMWNRESLRFAEGRASEYYLPIEYNRAEWKEFLEAEDGSLKHSAVIYGRLPMMVTAGCIRKTADKCRQVSGITELKDRYKTIFPVWHDCVSCYNVIYNSIPLSLHMLFREPAARSLEPMCCRLDFTVESKEETMEIIKLFRDYRSGMDTKPVSANRFTTAHYNRGVE